MKKLHLIYLAFALLLCSCGPNKPEESSTEEPSEEEVQVMEEEASEAEDITKEIEESSKELDEVLNELEN